MGGSPQDLSFGPAHSGSSSVCRFLSDVSGSKLLILSPVSCSWTETVSLFKGPIKGGVTTKHCDSDWFLLQRRQSFTHNFQHIQHPDYTEKSQTWREFKEKSSKTWGLKDKKLSIYMSELILVRRFERGLFFWEDSWGEIERVKHCLCGSDLMSG